MKRVGWTKLDKTGYAVSKSLLRRIRKIITQHGCRRICETGSGCSTLFFADYCLKNNVSYYSLETEKKYRRRTQKWLRLHEMDSMSDRVLLVKVNQLNSNDFRFVIPDVLGDIDFLFIDGPSDKTYGRRGVLFSLWANLAEESFVLIDDSNRKSAQKDIEAWSHTFGNLFCHIKTYKFGKRKSSLWKVNKVN